MSKDVHARLTKLSTLSGAVVDPLGARGAGPIDDGYTVLGYYVDAPKTGFSFQMSRYNSNGVEAAGFYITSPVELISREDSGDIGFKTANSRYRLQHL
jgi:hypothetical protein